MQTLAFQLTREHVALCDLLKLTGLTQSGGQSKAVIAAGEVRVNGVVDTRKTAKIRAGQIVEWQAHRIEVAGV